MTNENWDRLKPLFANAIDLGTAERSGFVADVLNRDEQLGRQLKSLVGAYERDDFVIDRLAVPLQALRAGDVPLFSAGEVVLGRFTIVRLIGSGGMGDVYEARDGQLGRIALKAIRSCLTGDPAVLDRFRREVQLARQISSYHVCRVYELFTMPKGEGPVSAFLTMEFLEGETLYDRLCHRGPVPWREAQTIAAQICEGLAAVHEAGVIHRDIKSKNIMLSERRGKPCAVLMDFGVAYGAPAACGETEAVTRGIAGTPEYMAPEQLETAGFSPATDIYALGLVLYETVTAVRPFEGGSIVAGAVRRAKGLAAASSVQAGVPRRWDEAIARCLRYEPGRRFGSARDVAEALRRPDPFRAVRRAVWANPRRRGVLGLTAAVLSLVGVLGWKLEHRYYVPTPAAMNWYRKGLEAFREATYLKAAGLFQSAAAADPGFALARARLADSWNELDFQGEASREMLAISAQDESRLKAADRTYVQAVRAELRHDFPSEVGSFRSELETLPVEEKAAGYVDLGRACERAGDIPCALHAYRQSETLDPDGPAAPLRLAALNARQGNNAQAATEFDRASQIYIRLGTLEGTAEVAYHRSYWQSVLRHWDEARRYARESFNAAANMPVPSVQLEVRALCRLSAISHGARDDDQAVADAARAISLAHDNGLEYWETDALIREGAGYFGKERLADAQGCFDRALKAAGRNQWPRLIALAQVNLAALRAGRQPQDVAGLTAAAGYYRAYQFPIEAFSAVLLLVRGQNDQSQYQNAVRSGLDLVSVAQRLDRPDALAQAQEELGTSFLGIQRYPDALARFNLALDAANTARDADKAGYEQAHRAEALALLGRYAEAEDALANVAAPYLAAEKIRIQGRILLGKGRYGEEVRLVKTALAADRAMDPAAAVALRLEGAVGAAETGLFQQARVWLREAVPMAKASGDAEALANAAEVTSLLNLRTHDARAAASSAEEGLAFFEAHGQPESEYLARCYLAQANQAVGQKDLGRQSASKAMDVARGFEHNWGTSAFQTYSRRADVSACQIKLTELTAR